MPVKTVRLCVELVQQFTREGLVELVVSLPGRDGTLTHRWACPDGIPDATQLEDIGSRAAGLVTQCLLLSGVQGQFKL